MAEQLQQSAIISSARDMRRRDPRHDQKQDPQIHADFLKGSERSNRTISLILGI